MRIGRWLLIEAAVAMCAAVVGWLLPDGLNLLSRAFGQPPLAVSPIERLLAALVTFMFATSLQVTLRIGTEIRKAQETFPATIETAIMSKAGQVVDASVARILLGMAVADPATLLRIGGLLRSAVEPVAHAHSYLQDAYAVIIERALANASHEMQKVTGGGLEVDIADHVEITHRLAERYGAYVHIQRRAFLVPAEWTKQWMQMIDNLPKRAIKCEYVVLLDRRTLVEERVRLQSMHLFLKARDWSFRYCDLQDVLDSFGGKLPTTWNLDVFGDEVVKLQETPAGRYHGGVRLRMAIFDLSHGAELRRMVTCVARFAQPYPPPDQAASIPEDQEERQTTEQGL
jgi:hypothetical protein